MRISRETIVPPEGGQEYKGVVEEIRGLEWKELSEKELQDLMYLAYTAAVEFAESLRIALELYPDNEKIREMAAGELNTKNLKLDDYDEAGDHSEFLLHFLEKNGLSPSEELQRFANEYQESCRRLSDNTRAMSVFSREQELPSIFAEILKARDWEAPGLEAFRFYLQEHIELDTSEGGHGELTEEMPIDDSVKPFYEARLQMYNAIPKLFDHEVS